MLLDSHSTGFIKKTDFTVGVNEIRGGSHSWAALRVDKEWNGDGERAVLADALAAGRPRLRLTGISADMSMLSLDGTELVEDGPVLQLATPRAGSRTGRQLDYPAAKLASAASNQDWFASGLGVARARRGTEKQSLSSGAG